MIIIEIILTIIAWNKGWRWKSLIPGGVIFAMGFMVGIVIVASGGSISNVGALAIVDVMGIIALIVLCLKKPSAKPLTPSDIK